MNDRLQQLALFVRTVETGSLSKSRPRVRPRAAFRFAGSGRAGESTGRQAHRKDDAASLGHRRRRGPLRAGARRARRCRGRRERRAGATKYLTRRSPSPAKPIGAATRAPLHPFAPPRPPRWLGAALRLLILVLVGGLIAFVANEWDWWVGSAVRQTTDDAYLHADQARKIAHRSKTVVCQTGWTWQAPADILRFAF